MSETIYLHDTATCGKLCREYKLRKPGDYPVGYCDLLDKTTLAIAGGECMYGRKWAYVGDITRIVKLNNEIRKEP